MAKIKKTKLEEAKGKAVSKKQIESIVNTSYYNENDILKHYIRKFYWKERVRIFIRDCNISDGVRYFTFCSRLAFDVRYFQQHNLLNFNRPFVFAEFLKDDFDFLINQFITKRFNNNATGFYGSLADISTITNNSDFGNFWSMFPFDIINLDYLGDILKSNVSSGIIGNNDFYAIQAIINNQSLLRRPYELWITIRAKSGRYDPSIKQEFRNLISLNLEQHSEFKKTFEKVFSRNKSVNNLDDDNLFIIGYLKWLWFVCKNAFSSINPNKISIIRYERIDKEGASYFLYNIFLRIEPYDQICIPSPAGQAAQYCNTEYIKGIQSCFTTPKDIDEEFKKLSKKDSLALQEELTLLFNQYSEDNNGFI